MHKSGFWFCKRSMPIGAGAAGVGFFIGRGIAPAARQPHVFLPARVFF